MFEFVTILLVSSSFGLCLGFIAEKRGVKVPFWVLMGAVFGPFAIPFVFFAKPKEPDSSQ